MSRPRDFEDLLDRLEGVERGRQGHAKADCPVPGHKTPKGHLVLTDAGDKALVTCHPRNHSYKEICAATDFDSLAYSDNGTKAKPELTLGDSEAMALLKQTYCLTDATIEHFSIQPDYKQKAWRYPVDGGTRYKKYSRKPPNKYWHTEGTPNQLYGYDDIPEGTAEVVLANGEPAVWVLHQAGIPSLCGIHGEGQLPDNTADLLKARGAQTVNVIPDLDNAGKEAASKDHNVLSGELTVRILQLPSHLGERADICDLYLWSRADKDAFVKAVRDLPEHNEAKPVKVEYETEGETLTWRRALGQHYVLFTTESIRQERTGIHARLGIHLDTEVLSWSYVNVEKHEDRVKLARAAHLQLPKIVSDQYAVEELRNDLDRFCIGLWDAYLSNYMPEFMEGDEEPQPLNFLLSRYVLEGGGTILFAPPGRGKSYTALLWGVSIDAGVSTFWPVKQKRVLLINLERSRQSVKRRLATVNGVLGLPSIRPILTLNARGKSLSDVIAACKKSIREHDVGLVILDSISRAGFGDLKENRPVTAIVDALSGLCDSWLALGHTPRANEDHIFGSIHFDAGADIVIQLLSQQAEGGTLGVGWQVTKQNDMARPPLSIYALEFEDTGLTGLRKAKPFEFPDIEQNRQQSILEQVIEYVLAQDTAEATATQVAGELGCDRAKVSRLFTQSGKFVQTRKEGRDVYYAVKEENV